MRVLMLAPGVGLGGADVGVVDWCASAAGTGIAPYLLTTQFGQDNSRFDDAASKCVTAEHLPNRLRPADMPAAILDVVDEHGIEVVHVMNSRVGFDLLPHLHARVPTVVQFHNEERSGRGFPRHVASRYDQWVSAYSVVSSDMAASLERHGVTPKKIHRILLGVDTDHYRSLSRSDTHSRILWAGRLSYQKRPELVLEIARVLRDRGVNARIDIAGGGELEGDLAASIHLERLGDLIELHGDIRDLISYYERAGLVLLTSRYEGIPRVIYEAFAMERPVVAPSVGGIGELVDERNGLLLDPAATADDYANEIEQLLNNPPMRAALGAAGRARVLQDGSLHTMIDAHRALYEECIRSHTPTDCVSARAGVPNDSIALLLTTADERATSLRRADSIPGGERALCVVGYLSDIPHGDSVPLRNEHEAHTLGHATLVPLPGALPLDDAIAFAVWRAEQALGHELPPPSHRALATAEAAFIDHPLLGPGAPSSRGEPRDLRATIIAGDEDGLAQLAAVSLQQALESDGIRVTRSNDIDASTGPLGALIIVGEHPLLDPAVTEDHPTRPSWIIVGNDHIDTPIMNRAQHRIAHCLAALHLDGLEARRWHDTGISAQFLHVPVSVARPEGGNAISNTVFIGPLSAHSEELLAHAIEEQRFERPPVFAIRDTAIAGLTPEPTADILGGVQSVLSATGQLLAPNWSETTPPSRFLLNLAQAWGIDVIQLGDDLEREGPSDLESMSAEALRGLIEQSTAIREVAIALHGDLLTFGEAAATQSAAAPESESDSRHGKRDRGQKRQSLERIALLRALAPEREAQRTSNAAWDRAEPAITVVITAYQQSEYVIECVRSILVASKRLTDAQIECIVDTDGDSEAFAMVQDRISEGAPEFIGIPVLCVDAGVNRGLAAARNHAADFARAPLLFFLDADDVLEPEGLALLTSALDADPDAGFSYGLLRLFGQREGLANRYPWSRDRLVHGNYIGSLTMIRRDAYQKVRGFDPEMNDRYGGFEDYELWLKFAAQGERGAFVPSVVAAYRQSAATMVSTTLLDVWSVVAALQQRYPTLPWPFRLERDTNADAVPDLERIGTMSEKSAQRALKRLERKLKSKR